MRFVLFYYFIPACFLVIAISGCNSKKDYSQEDDNEFSKKADEPSYRFGSGDAEMITNKSSQGIPASLLRILVHPDYYHGKEVSIEGFLRIEFEGNAITLYKEDDGHMLTDNAIWVSTEDNAMKMNDEELKNKFSEKYVFLSGIFDKNDKGHLNAFQGSIKNITAIRVKRNRAENRQLKEDSSQQNH